MVITGLIRNQFAAMHVGSNPTRRATRISLQAGLPLAGFSFCVIEPFAAPMNGSLKLYVAAYWRCNTPVRLFDGLQGTAQPIYHCVSGGQLGIVVQMCVDVGGGRKIAMSQPFLDLFHRNTVCKQK